MKHRHFARLTLAVVLVCLFAALSAGAGASRARPARAAAPATALQTFNLADFGAVGDGQADDGPALQAALDAVIAAGGGRLDVPAGRYAIVTPVLAIGPVGFDVPLEIRGVESTTPIAGPHDGGYALTRGLDLTSEFLPRTGGTADALTFWNFRSLLIQDIAFVGSPPESTDAKVTLAMADAVDAVIRHCEFYGLATVVPNGSIVQAQRSHLSIEQTAFLGCTANSGLYTPIVQNWDWKGIKVEDVIFADYGQRPDLYGKLGIGAPLCWVSVGHPAERTAASPRREAVFRNVFMDEGGWQGITVHPGRYQSSFVPLDLFYATNLYVNVSNFWTTGHYLSGVREVLVENGLYTWAERADSAIHVYDAQDAILDRVVTEKSATRLRAEAGTGRLTVIDSVYEDLASGAAQTVVLTPATPDDDPVRYVRARFEAVLGRGPDAAAHYYWSRRLLDCGANAPCVTTQRAALAAYLAASPAPTFAITGRTADSAGQPFAGVAVTLSGSQSVSTTTAADGSYSFERLPTSGVYTVTVGTKRHYTFNNPARTVTTPAGAQVLDFTATLNRYAVSGRLTDERGRAIAGATLTLAGAQAATTTSDSNGNYTFASLSAGGNYTVNAASTRYTFAAPAQSFTDLDGDKTANFSGTSLFYNVTGQVLDSTNKPVNGLALALSGGRTAATTTDAQGNFSFADLPRGANYTVTPAKLVGYTFTPASRTFNNLTTDQAAPFTAVPTNFKVGGRVTSGGNALAGVTVALSGTKLATATTDAAGAYSFNVPVHGDYTVAPSKTHYTFDRASATFNGVAADQTADFVATLNRHRIAGSVKRPGGVPMSGITVTLSGGQAATATTDSNGNYAFANLPAGAAYTVAAARPGYDFAPASKSFAELGADSAADFTVTPANIPLTGSVTSGGAPLAGATVTLSGSKSGTATTDAAGAYTFTITSEGSYTVTAAKTHYTFSPPSQTFTNPTSARTASFDAALNRHKITGRVVDKNTAGLAGVQIALTGSLTVNAVTDAQGNFSLNNLLASGNYTVTASKAHYTFSPAGAPFNDLGSDQTLSFTGALVDYRISGRVTSGDAGLAGVAVTLSGSKSGAATTDAAGAYFFDVPAEGNYTVTVSKTHYTFTPASATFASLAGNRTADFGATLNRYKVGGRLTDKNNAGIQGATVTLSGTQSGTATTDAQGNYTFQSLAAGGSYTLTAARANYTFAPASLAVGDLGADSANNNFTGTLADYTLSGRVTSGGAPLADVTVTLSGSKSGAATTDAAGAYTFTVPAEGGYTLTPSKKHYTFAPSARSFNNLSSSQTADFEATLNRHRIAGRVAYANGAGLAGATVTLSGAQAATATTDAQGNYTFANLAAGGDYTVTPALAHHTFAPASQSFGELSADASAAFTAAAVEYRIAGLVTEKGAPLAGVEVTLEGEHPGLGAQAGRVTTGADGAYSFGVPAGGDYTVTPGKKNYGFDPASAAFKELTSDGVANFAATLRSVVGFASASYSVGEGGGSLTATVTREGDTSAAAWAVYEAEGDTAKRGSDFVTSIGLVSFAPGETSKTVTIFITDDSFVEGAERFTMTLTEGVGAVADAAAVASVTINDNDTASSPANPIDADEFFVREQYRDFFGRDADAPGLKFWTDEIKKCSADAQCREARRVSVSAAFFLSIEFRETGYFAYRLYRATYGRTPERVGEFMLDSRVVGDGVVVGAAGWEQRLAANKRAFLEEWAQRPEFEERYGGFTDWWFVQSLFDNMGVTLSEARRAALLAKLSAGASRAEVLAEVIDDEQFNKQEFNRAFVLMQYFGYLRRDPTEPPDSDLSGYNFWLSKLNEFSGDYEKAEMVRAFLSSTEYRGRFGN